MKIYNIKFVVKKLALSIFSLLITSFFFSPSFGQGFGNGTDGSPNISGIINQYAVVIAIADSSCGTYLTVDNGTIFHQDDLVLLIQMQGASIQNQDDSDYGKVINLNNAGNFQFFKVASVNGNSVVLNGTPQNNFDVSGNVQLIHVPQYQSPTVIGILSCPAWDGSKGGVIALDALGTVTLNAEVNAVGEGFRGGITEDAITNDSHLITYVASHDPSKYSQKGEGIAGFGVPPEFYGRGSPANGGGGGNAVNAGGGGGSNLTTAGNGGYGYSSPAYGGNDSIPQGLGGKQMPFSISYNRVFLGGGAGAGHNNDNESTNGASGGGIVIVTCGTLNGNAQTVNAAANSADDAQNDGAGGGGGGGSVLIYCSNFTSTLRIDTHGGKGGNCVFSISGFHHGPGGGGSGGLAWFKTVSLPPQISGINDLGGVNGINSDGDPHGATPGEAGSISFGLSLTMDTSSTTSTSQSLQICAGNQVTLNAPSGQNYQWSPSTGLSCDTCQNPVATLSQSAIYIVTFTASGGCQVVDTFKVKVNSISVVATASSKPVYCSGDTVQLHAHILPDTSSNIIYSWTPSAGLSCTNCPDPVSTIDSSIDYIINITSASGCPASDTIHINAQKIELTTIPANICIGDSTQLEANFSPDTLSGVSYQWTPAAGLSCTTCPDPFAQPGSTTTYYITVTTPAGCLVEDSATVTVRDKDVIELSATPSATIVAGDSVQLSATGGFNYTWTPATGLSCTSCPNPIAKPDSTTTYFVMSNDGKCSSQDTITIIVLPACKDLALPSAFTPNGDGHNDIYHLLFNAKGNLQLKYFRIYNRWGQVVFDTDNLLTGWDGKFKGKAEPLGTYVWVVDAICNDKEIFQKGNVTLLR